MPQDRLLSTAEVAERLGLTGSRIRQLIQTGQLPAVRIGGRWVVELEAVEAFRARPPGRPHHPRGT